MTMLVKTPRVVAVRTTNSDTSIVGRYFGRISISDFLLLLLLLYHYCVYGVLWYIIIIIYVIRLLATSILVVDKRIATN